MGLFGFVKRAVGKLAKAGLSAVTHGASDVVLRSLKRTGNTTHNPVSKSNLSPAQQQALVAKLTDVTPSVKNTESVLADAQAGTNRYGIRHRSKQARARGKPKGGFVYELDAGDPRNAAMAARARKRGGSTRTLSAAETRRKRTPEGPSKRRLTPAMQAMANKSKQLAAQWRSLGGQAGTGQTFFDWKRGR